MIIVRRRVTNKQANFGIGNVLKEPFRRYGRAIADQLDEQLGAAAKEYARNPSQKNAQWVAANQQAGNWARANPGKQGAIAVAGHGVALGAGIGTALGVRSFIRRRRTKNGKIVVEQVNRK